jgi:hypothetical protein
VDHPARQIGTRTKAGKRAIKVDIGGVQEFHYQNAGQLRQVRARQETSESD